MIFLLYLISGLLLTAATFLPLVWHSRFARVEDKTNLVNGLAIAQSALYLILTIYVIVAIKLPFYDLQGYLMADPLAIYEVLITTIVFLLAAIYGRGYVKTMLERESFRHGQVGLFYTMFNLLMIVIVFSFFSNNLALFWLLLELTTIMSGILIVVLNAKENIIAALKYIFIASTAMLFSFIGLIILFALTKQVLGAGTLNWNVLMQNAGVLSPKYFGFAFIFIFIGFAAKAGIAPFHTWLPQAHARAPSNISAVLSAVLLNCGIFGILRLYAVAHQTASWKLISIFLVVFGAISIAIAAFSMLSRTNIKKLIAFSSIEHMGIVLIGIGIGTPIAIFWILFHILAHALNKCLLFFSAGILHHQYDSNRMPKMQKAFKLQPLATWGVIIGSVAVIGMPPFPIFLSKLFILTQIGSYSLVLLIIVLILFLIVASAFAYLLIQAFTQQTETEVERYTPHQLMNSTIIFLIIALIGAGLCLSFGFSNLLTVITGSLGF